MKEDETVRACNWHTNKTVTTLRKHMLPNINTCENGWSNFSENLRVVTIKLLELTQFASPNLSVYFNFALVLGSVVMQTFLKRPVRSPFIEKSMVCHISY